ncbi:MAG: tRNA lysidine(34) synthetase TilS [Cyanobacteria bacterium J06638_22]
MTHAFSWTPFHARLHQTLRQRRLLERGQRILIAVSGGQDSVCLAQLLHDLQKHWHWHLAIAHCNHGWRSDADANADHVKALAQQWQLPFYGRTATEVILSEAQAREWRYAILIDIARQDGYTSIITGHTGSDRAETLLYNLMRGSGIDGLQALTWRRSLGKDLTLVRPLLDFTRSDTAEVCEDHDLKIWYDTTNDDLSFARNRIRQEVVPYLQEHFNPQVETHLSHTAELLRADVTLLEALAERLHHRASDPNATNRLSRSLLQSAPLALQRRVVRRFLKQQLPSLPQFDHIEKLVQLLDAPNRSQSDPFPGGAIARVDGDWVSLQAPGSPNNTSNN